MDEFPDFEEIDKPKGKKSQEKKSLPAVPTPSKFSKESEKEDEEEAKEEDEEVEEKVEKKVSQEKKELHPIDLPVFNSPAKKIKKEKPEKKIKPLKHLKLKIPKKKEVEHKKPELELKKPIPIPPKKQVHIAHKSTVHIPHKIPIQAIQAKPVYVAPKKPVVVKEKHAERKVTVSVPTIKLVNERDIVMDFATKVYARFDRLVKSIVLFGSQNKQTATPTSDIDIIILVDDASIRWDDELISWYREELGRVIQQNPYRKSLHINSVRLSTWWNDLINGDPVVINIIRYGDALIDFGGFFDPLKVLLEQGKIKSTPEAIYTALQRSPMHLSRSRAAKLSTIEGLYWAMVDSAHALMMTAKQSPPSPEHIPIMLKEMFVDTKKLKMKYVLWYRDLYILHRKIGHGSITDIKGQEIDDWQARADEFVSVMTSLIKSLIE